MSDLQHVRVAVLATDGFEESELTEPRKALEGAGAQVEVISEKPGEIQGFRHHDKAGRVRVDRTLARANPADYDALLLPGGALNADRARALPEVSEFIRHFDRAGKPIAAICHAPWELISAGVIRGRKVTSWPTIQEDIRNADADWLDREVVLDGNLLTSRGPRDLPAFRREMLALFARLPAGARS